MGLIGVVLLMGPGQEKRHHDDRFHADAERTNGHTTDNLRSVPIALPPHVTTGAALFGALPLAVGLGDDGELRRLLGIAIVGRVDPEPDADALYDTVV